MYGWGMPITLANGSRLKWPVRVGFTQTLFDETGPVLIKKTVARKGRCARIRR